VDDLQSSAHELNGILPEYLGRGMTKVTRLGSDKLPDFTICAVVSIREQKQRSTCGARIDLQLPIPKLKVRTTRESGCLRAIRSG